MILQINDKWVLMDGDKICRAALPHEIPFIEKPAVEKSTVSSPYVEKLQTRKFGYLQKAKMCQSIMDEFGVVEKDDPGVLGDTLEEKLMLTVRDEVAVLQSEVVRLAGLVEKLVNKKTFWERIITCLRRVF